MKVSTILLGCALGARSAFAHAFDLPFEVSEEQLDQFEKRQSGGIITSGAPGSGTHPRYEIRQLELTKPNQWTLFILAMQQFQAEAQTSATSYYQIAGIHGVPRQNYDNVGQCAACSGTDGYCTHDSILFPSWHRAYMALFEQQFVSIANNIANNWPTSGAPTTRAEMQGAASTIRFPYWDWAAIPRAGLPSFPNLITQSSVTIRTQTGTRSIANPLFRHDFADSSRLVYTPFINQDRTFRWPTANSNSAVSQNGLANNAVTNSRASLRDQLSQLFETCKDYAHFSNDVADSSSTRCSNSLEAIHNTIHTNVGGPGGSINGHMFYLATASFDPVFWLHHMNVDRIFALWQAINPNSYGGSQTAPHSTWTIAQGSTQNSNSPLTPFRSSSGSFWTTSQVRQMSTFRYTYPEFQNSGSIISQVRALYGSSGSTSQRKRSVSPPTGNMTTGYPTGSPATSNSTGNLTTPLTASNGSLYQYVANIQTPRYELNGSYYVYIFLGEPKSEEPSDWISDDNLVGPMGIISQPGMQRNVTIAGSIPLSRALTAKYEAGELPDLCFETVAPYLKKELKWKIAAGEEVEPSKLSTFKVGAYGTTKTQPESEDELPEYSEFIPIFESTEGKAGGAKPDSPMICDQGTESDASAPTEEEPESSPVPTGTTGGRTITLTTTVCPVTTTATCPA